MRFGVRARLFVVSVLLVACGVLAFGIALERQLRRRLAASEEEDVRRAALAARALVLARAAAGRGLGDADEVADELGAVTGLRITIVGADGNVLGDSALAPAEIARVDNHAGRPEIVAARRTGEGRARRYSTTVRAELVYVALPVDDDSGWIVRAAKPLREVDEAVAELRRNLAATGLAGLVVAALLSALASHWLGRPLRTLAASAQAIARGTPAPRMRADRPDELGLLAGSLNRVADQIRGAIDQLAGERARFSAVLEAMTDGVVAIDADRRITLVNGAAANLLDADDRAIGRPLVDVLRAPAIARLLDARDGDVELEVGDGRKIRARASRLPDDSGWVLVLSDITDLHRLATVRRDFVANVSHELRTPVSVVQATAETLLDGALDDPAHARPMVEALHRNAVRMAALIADLLDLARIEAGRYALDSARVAVSAIAERAIAAARPAAAARGSTIAVDVAAGLAVRGDAGALEHVLANLLDNAIKYAGDGARIAVSARAAGDRVTICVTDDGPGIPAAHRERVFERFYRVDPGRSRAQGGTGLGLAIVKHLVEAMSGTVRVDAAHPSGAAFRIDLPAA